MFLFEFEKGDIIASKDNNVIFIVGNTQNEFCCSYVKDEERVDFDCSTTDYYNRYDDFHYANDSDIKLLNDVLKEQPYTYFKEDGLFLHNGFLNLKDGDECYSQLLGADCILKEMKIIRNTRNCVDVAFYCHVMYDINDFIYGYGRWDKDDEDDIITKIQLEGWCTLDCQLINQTYFPYDNYAECGYISELDNYIEYNAETNKYVYKNPSLVAEYEDYFRTCGDLNQEIDADTKPIDISDIHDSSMLHNYINMYGFTTELKNHYSLTRFGDKWKNVLRAVIYGAIEYSILTSNKIESYEQFIKDITKRARVYNIHQDTLDYIKAHKDNFFHGLGFVKFESFLKYCISKNVYDEETLRYVHKLYTISMHNLLAKYGDGGMNRESHYKIKSDTIKEVCEWLKNNPKYDYGKQPSGNNSRINAIVYFELPDGKQVSFHTELNDSEYNSIKDYEKEWDYEVCGNTRHIEAFVNEYIPFKPLLKEFKELVNSMDKKERKKFFKMLKDV